MHTWLFLPPREGRGREREAHFHLRKARSYKADAGQSVISCDCEGLCLIVPSLKDKFKVSLNYTESDTVRHPSFLIGNTTFVVVVPAWLPEWPSGTIWSAGSGQFSSQHVIHRLCDLKKLLCLSEFGMLSDKAVEGLCDKAGAAKEILPLCVSRCLWTFSSLLFRRLERRGQGNQDRKRGAARETRGGDFTVEASAGGRLVLCLRPCRGPKDL